MRFLRLVFLATILGPPAIAFAQSKADEQAVRTLPKDFCAAWAKHDGHALANIVADDVDFVTAIKNYVSEWSRHSEIYAEFDAIGVTSLKLNANIENNLYRITQEALNNAAKHAKANRINVLLEKRGEYHLGISECIHAETRLQHANIFA